MEDVPATSSQDKHLFSCLNKLLIHFEQELPTKISKKPWIHSTDPWRRWTSRPAPPLQSGKTSVAPSTPPPGSCPIRAQDGGSGRLFEQHPGEDGGQTSSCTSTFRLLLTSFRLRNQHLLQHKSGKISTSNVKLTFSTCAVVKEATWKPMSAHQYLEIEPSNDENDWEMIQMS